MYDVVDPTTSEAERPLSSCCQAVRESRSVRCCAGYNDSDTMPRIRKADIQPPPSFFYSILTRACRNCPVLAHRPAALCNGVCVFWSPQNAFRLCLSTNSHQELRFRLVRRLALKYRPELTSSPQDRVDRFIVCASGPLTSVSRSSKPASCSIGSGIGQASGADSP